MVNVPLPESGIALLILIKETQLVVLGGSGIMLDCNDSEKQAKPFGQVFGQA